MATYVLIPGAGCDAWLWHRVTPLLRARGHDTVAVELPCEDDSAGLAEYADAVVTAVGDRADLVLVAHSLGGFTAPLVCERLPVGLMVLLTAMVPSPGESPGDWWTATGHAQAVREVNERHGRPADAPFDPDFAFLNGVPPEIAAQVEEHSLNQSGTPFLKPWPLPAWPDVPTRFLVCRDDRFFPAGFQRRVVRERLGIVPDETAGGHLAPLSHPEELVERLEAFRTTL